MKTLQEVIAAQPPESRERIKRLTDELVLETGLQLLREELHISRKCWQLILVYHNRLLLRLSSAVMISNWQH